MPRPGFEPGLLRPQPLDDHGLHTCKKFNLKSHTEYLNLIMQQTKVLVLGTFPNGCRFKSHSCQEYVSFHPASSVIIFKYFAYVSRQFEMPQMTL